MPKIAFINKPTPPPNNNPRFDLRLTDAVIKATLQGSNVVVLCDCITTTISQIVRHQIVGGGERYGNMITIGSVCVYVFSFDNMPDGGACGDAVIIRF